MFFFLCSFLNKTKQRSKKKSRLKEIIEIVRVKWKKIEKIFQIEKNNYWLNDKLGKSYTTWYLTHKKTLKYIYTHTQNKNKIKRN